MRAVSRRNSRSEDVYKRQELISRFYDVQEGEVLIGGKNVKELNYDTILKNVAIVFQKTFQMCIRDRLTAGILCWITDGTAF